MKLVRILTDHPELAGELQSLFESRDFAVDVGADEDPFAPVPDIEIDLKLQPRDEALRMARELAKTELDVFRAPAIALPAVPAPTEAVNERVRECELPRFVVVPIRPEPVPAERTSINPAAQRLTSLSRNGFKKAHLQEVARDVMRAAKKVGNKSVVLAEVSVAQWLLRLGCVLKRKRAVVARKRARLEAGSYETRLSLAHLRHGRGVSQNASLKIIVAGVAVMTILLCATVWRGYHWPTSRQPSETHAQLGSSAAKDTNRGTAVQRDEVRSAASTPGSPHLAANAESAHHAVIAKKPARPRDSQGQRGAVSHDEVVVHHYQTQQPKQAPATRESAQISGIKHITDIN